MSRTAELNNAKTVTPNDVDVFLGNAAWAILLGETLVLFSRNYEARGASGEKYEARIAKFRILLAINRFSQISWKVESRRGKSESRWRNLESHWRKRKDLEENQKSVRESRKPLKKAESRRRK
jgi:hypothetical protein